MKKFIDECTITVSSGKGGAGCVSFRREKYVPRGGPDGGDGGRGGHVVFISDHRIKTLYDVRRKQRYKAGNGRSGLGRNRSGGKGDSCIIRVPVGTIITERESGMIFADFKKNGEEFVAVHGGRGGLGNQHFATSVNQTPGYAQPGLPGEELILDLELKIIADVGLIGFPNAGKSTLLKALSRANPKTASYPFTTLNPNLGVVQDPTRPPFVVADIPGITEGASEGKGLGIKFLKHIERTRLLLIVVDLFSDDAQTAKKTLLHELESFSAELMQKPMLFAANKVDLPEAREAAASERDFIPISGAAHIGLDPLIDSIYRTLNRVTAEEQSEQ